MADNLARMEAQIRALEARRAKGESVPELDALYEQMDRLTRAGAATASKYPTGEIPTTATPLRAPAMPPAPMIRRAKGGSIGSASKRADGCAQRGKTKGRMV